MYLWARLLMRAQEESEYLYEILLYFKKVGTNIVPHQRYGFKLQPVYSEKNGWKNIGEYNEERKYLIPFGETLKNLLLELRRDMDHESLF